MKGAQTLRLLTLPSIYTVTPACSEVLWLAVLPTLSVSSAIGDKKHGLRDPIRRVVMGCITDPSRNLIIQ